MQSGSHKDFAAPSSEHELKELENLKKHLGFVSTACSDVVSQQTYPDTAVDLFLLRYLHSANFSTEDAIAKLMRRRTFERALPPISITPNVVRVLRSGAVRELGKDKMGRPVLYLVARDAGSLCSTPEDVERLFITVFEYMLMRCFASCFPAEEAHRNRQQFVLLVNEEKTRWEENVPFFQNAMGLATFVSNYYPNLLGRVLVVGASEAVCQGIASLTAVSPTKTEGLIRMIQRQELPLHMENNNIPIDLGGTLGGGDSATDFSERILRHWYTLTTFLILEAQPRKLYQLPPYFSDTQQYVALQRKSLLHVSITGASPNIAGRRPGRATQVPIRGGTLSQPGQYNTNGSMHLSSRGGGLRELGIHSAETNDLLGETLTFDDGLCSLLSDDLHEARDFDDVDTISIKFGATLKGGDTYGDLFPPPLSDDQLDKIRSNPVYAIAMINQERERRMRLEEQLQRIESGMALDPHLTCSIEKALSTLHQDVSVLTANIVVRAKGVVGNGDSPSLSQLLELTTTALREASRTSMQPPALRLAQPVQRHDQTSDKCCCFM